MTHGDTYPEEVPILTKLFHDKPFISYGMIGGTTICFLPCEKGYVVHAVLWEAPKEQFAVCKRPLAVNRAPLTSALDWRSWNFYHASGHFRSAIVVGLRSCGSRLVPTAFSTQAGV